jgi:hypothetical protein
MGLLSSPVRVLYLLFFFFFAVVFEVKIYPFFSSSLRLQVPFFFARFPTRKGSVEDCWDIQDVNQGNESGMVYGARSVVCLNK